MNISVVIPSYNSTKTIESCIKSLISGTLKPHEIIVVDDNSTDDSVEKVERIAEASEVPIKLIKCSVNLGPATATAACNYKCCLECGQLGLPPHPIGGVEVFTPRREEA